MDDGRWTTDENRRSAMLNPSRSSLKRHIILSAILGIAIAFIIAGGMLIWGFKQSALRSLDNYLIAFMNTLIASTVIEADGSVTLSPNISGIERLPQYWQVTSGGKLIQKSHRLTTVILLNDAPDGEIQHFTSFDDRNTSIYALKRTVRFPGGVAVTYMIGTQKELAERFLEEQQKEFSLYLVGVLSALGCGLVLLSFVQIRIIQKPLNRLHHSIAELKQGNIAELSEPFPAEIQPLVHELNTLLSYNTKMLERYRTFSSNLSHALKTPLSIIKNEAALSHDPLAQKVLEQADSMNGLITRYLSRVRIGGTANILGVRTPLLPVIQKIAAGFGKLYRKEVRISGGEDVVVPIDESDLFELLGNLIENACKYGKSRVEVEILHEGEQLTIHIHDDGNGIPEALREEVLKRGVRLDETTQGSGIGIPIAVDIVELYGGVLTLQESRLGGLEVVVRL
jgi:signal transduction histidine kinase